MEESNESLTNEEVWDKAWGNINLPVYFDKNERSLVWYHRHFIKNFPINTEFGDKKLLEVGCGASKWLPYFRQEFGYEIWGLDSSKVGVQTARANLKLLKTEGTIIQGDLFTDNDIPTEYFDIVISLGLIEHFTNPVIVLQKIVKLTKRGG
jgi:2-polyprenyl-3-methyl-5-hydroxy-6-metoxy-1,4-benzoquinol methylase